MNREEIRKKTKGTYQEFQFEEKSYNHIRDNDDKVFEK